LGSERGSAMGSGLFGVCSRGKELSGLNFVFDGLHGTACVLRGLNKDSHTCTDSGSLQFHVRASSRRKAATKTAWAEAMSG
jgi:hypothetical protein